MAKLLFLLPIGPMMAAVVLVFAWGHWQLPFTQAVEGPPVEMSLDVKSGAVCDVAPKPTKCDVPVDGKFILGVLVNTWPPGGYMGFQTEIDYDGLIYWKGDQADEIVWKMSTLPARFQDPPVVAHFDFFPLGPPWSDNKGNVVELDVSCPPEVGSYVIDLVPYGPFDLRGTALVDVNQVWWPASDSLTINCVPPEPSKGNDDFADAVLVPEPLPYSNKEDTTGAGAEPQEPTQLIDGDCFPEGMGTSVWYMHTPSYAQTLTADTFGSDYDTQIAVWSGTDIKNLTFVGCNDDSGEGWQSEVIFAASAGTTYYFQLDSYAGDFGNLIFNLVGEPEPSKGNDDFADAVLVPEPLPYSNKEDTTGAGAEPQEPFPTGGCLPEAMGTSVWYMHTPSYAQTLTADTFGSDYDTQIAVWSGTDIKNLTFVGCNDDSGGGWQSEVIFAASAGTTYYFQLDSYAGEFGNLIFNLEGPPDPDKDGDGCLDVAEQQPKADAAIGGGRNPNYFWDVYDVNHDGHIDLFIDIFGVANRFGASSVPPLSKADALAEALSPAPPPAPPAYHAAFDRSAAFGPNVWNIGPPDGNIDLFNDIFGVANQFGLNCK